MKLVASFLLFAGAATVSEDVKVGKTMKDLLPDMDEPRR
jgi:hypothetical protein